MESRNNNHCLGETNDVAIDGTFATYPGIFLKEEEGILKHKKQQHTPAASGFVVELSLNDSSEAKRQMETMVYNNFFDVAVTRGMIVTINAFDSNSGIANVRETSSKERLLNNENIDHPLPNRSRPQRRDCVIIRFLFFPALLHPLRQSFLTDRFLLFHGYSNFVHSNANRAAVERSVVQTVSSVLPHD